MRSQLSTFWILRKIANPTKADKSCGDDIKLSGYQVTRVCGMLEWEIQTKYRYRWKQILWLLIMVFGHIPRLLMIHSPGLFSKSSPDLNCGFCIIRIYQHQHICNAFCSFSSNMTTKHRLHTKWGNLFPANEESSEQRIPGIPCSEWIMCTPKRKNVAESFHAII